MKLNSKLPTHYNGIGQIEAELIEDPKSYRVAIIQFNCSQITTDTLDNEQEATITIRRIELVTGDVAERVKKIYQEAYEDRVGTDALPFDEERDALENGVNDHQDWLTIYEASIEDAPSGEWTVVELMLNSEAIDEHEATYVQIGHPSNIFNASELTDFREVGKGREVDGVLERKEEATSETESTEESENVDQVASIPFSDLCESCNVNPKENKEGKWCVSCRDDFKESDSE